MEIKQLFAELGLSSSLLKASAKKKERALEVCSPIDGKVLTRLRVTTEREYDEVIVRAHKSFQRWRDTPAPKRGEIVRQIGHELRAKKKLLGRLVTIEVGKILAEGEGEVQEAIDVADFAVGLSRQLYGLSMHSERPSHRMYEQWHPLGVVGVITAFNFPMAVWAWNSMLAAVCGDVLVWKPSEFGALCALAINTLSQKIASAHGYHDLFQLVIGDGPELGKAIAADARIPLVSATGSSAMGKSVGAIVASRYGKSILELGGNNAIIVLNDADFELAVPSVVFGAVGTAGQRCTSTRRILVQRERADEFVSRLTEAYQQVRIGSPLEAGTLMGPLINQRAVSNYRKALATIKKQGGKIIHGGKVLKGMLSPLYVEPTIVRAKRTMEIMHHETFAPILYVVEVKDLDDALALHNAVPQGLSSAIFTQSLKCAERFLSSAGSDCGIANVNIGTSGAEIGGAFGGEKETGGGRESGSDSWRQYMRRQTNTINYSTELPLAQGINFTLGKPAP